MRELYAAELTFVDRWIGRLLNKMDDLGLMDNTAVMYLCDHGLTLGEYGLLGKHAAYPNWPIYRVPYMIREPGGKKLAGEKSQYFASTHDVASTLLGFQGIRAPGLMDGEDLSRLFDGKKPYDDARLLHRLLRPLPDLRRRPLRADRAQREAADPPLRHRDRSGGGRQHRRAEPGDRRPAVGVLEQEAGGTLPQFGDEMVMGG